MAGHQKMAAPMTPPPPRDEDADEELDVAELDHHLHHVTRPEFWPGLVGQQVDAAGAALTPSPRWTIFVAVEPSV